MPLAVESVQEIRENLELEHSVYQHQSQS
jgi:hypothetical protein